MAAGGVPRRLRGHEPPRSSVRSVSRTNLECRKMHRPYERGRATRRVALTHEKMEPSFSDRRWESHQR